MMCTVFLSVPSFNSQRDGILLRNWLNIAIVSLPFQFPTGWNSTMSRVEVEAKRPFQFPTGWNSTGYRISLQIEYSPFQFPTGWNSTIAQHNRSLFLRQVSIPNGMEFYQSASGYAKSTRSVSIPNGMEFYQGIIPIVAFGLTCFNSQRDGILLDFLEWIIHHIYCFNSQRDGILLDIGIDLLVFQPGFNSQRDGILLARRALGVYDDDRFNSQRDGILHRSLRCIRWDSPQFQFPTGWNSTLIPLRACSPDRVSIPNGMEFYDLSVNREFIKFSFNSQRDGSL